MAPTTKVNLIFLYAAIILGYIVVTNAYEGGSQ